MWGKSISRAHEEISRGKGAAQPILVHHINRMYICGANPIRPGPRGHPGAIQSDFARSSRKSPLPPPSAASVDCCKNGISTTRIIMRNGSKVDIAEKTFGCNNRLLYSIKVLLIYVVAACSGGPCGCWRTWFGLLLSNVRSNSSISASMAFTEQLLQGF